MSLSIRPTPFSLEGDIVENWRKFMQCFETGLKATGHKSDSSCKKANLLLSFVGEAALELFNTFQLSDRDRNDYDKVIQAFEKYVVTQKNVVVERFNFNTRVQGASESFDVFFVDLIRLAETCEFGDQMESIIRDRIVVGISDRSLQAQLLKVADLSLRKTVVLCRAAELSQESAEPAQEPASRISSATKKLSSQHQPRPSTSREVSSPGPGPSTSHEVSSRLSSKVKECISKAYAESPSILKREKLDVYLKRVKGKKNPKSLAKKFTKNVNGLIKLLDLISEFYYKSEEAQTKEDKKFIDWLDKLIDRLKTKKS